MSFMPPDAHTLKTTNDPEDAFAYIQQQQAANLDMLRAIAQQTRKVAPKTKSFEADLGFVAQMGPKLIVARLESGEDIAFCYVENQGAAATVNVYVGDTASGRLLNAVKKGTWKCFPVTDGVTSLSVVASGNDTGVVRVTVTDSRDWAPAQGTAV